MTMCNLSDCGWVRSRTKASRNNYTTTQSQKDAWSKQSIRGLTSLASTLLVQGRPSGPPMEGSAFVISYFLEMYFLPTLAILNLASRLSKIFKSKKDKL